MSVEEIREKAAAEAIIYHPGNRADFLVRQRVSGLFAAAALKAADRADREAGIHRVRVDYSTVERVARVLFAQRDVGESGFGAWDDQEQGPSDEEKGWFLDDARAVLAALTGAES